MYAVAMGARQLIKRQITDRQVQIIDRSTDRK